MPQNAQVTLAFCPWVTPTPLIYLNITALGIGDPLNGRKGNAKVVGREFL